MKILNEFVLCMIFGTAIFGGIRSWVQDLQGGAPISTVIGALALSVTMWLLLFEPDHRGEGK